MWTTAAKIICSIMVLECAIILIGNIFTIYVFWTHRKRLKRTSILLINLAVADLLVGLTELPGIASGTIPQHFEKGKMMKETTHDNMTVIIPTMFSLTSLFCLVLISLERAYAVIWPLRHRVASTKMYICGTAVVWVGGVTVATLLSLNSFKVFGYTYTMVPVCIMQFSSLVIICISYLSIRTRLQFRAIPAAKHQNRQNNEEQNMKLSRTLFIVIAASFVCWLPGSVSYFIYVFCECEFSVPLLYSGTLFNIGSSIVNPVIYSFRMPIFKEMLKRLKPRRASRKYSVN